MFLSAFKKSDVVIENFKTGTMEKLDWAMSNCERGKPKNN